MNINADSDVMHMHFAHTHIHVLANQMSNKGITKGSTAFDA